MSASQNPHCGSAHLSVGHLATGGWSGWAWEMATLHAQGLALQSTPCCPLTPGHWSQAGSWAPACPSNSKEEALPSWFLRSGTFWIHLPFHMFLACSPTLLLYEQSVSSGNSGKTSAVCVPMSVPATVWEAREPWAALLLWSRLCRGCFTQTSLPALCMLYHLMSKGTSSSEWVEKGGRGTVESWGADTWKLDVKWTVFVSGGRVDRTSWQTGHEEWGKEKNPGL